MADCEQLRNNLSAAKAARNQAMSDNAHAENAGRQPLHDGVALDALRLAVDVAALEARNAGCDISDLVGDNVGRLDP